MSHFTEARHDVAVGRDAVAVMTRLKGFNQDGITVTMKYEHDVAVTRGGADGRLSHVISIKFNDRIDDHIEFVQCSGGNTAGE